MKTERCEWTREAMADVVAGRLDVHASREVSRHLAECASCRDEGVLAALLFQARPEPPAALAAQIKGAIRFRTNALPRPWWGLAAAAVAAVALGIGTAGEPLSPEVPEFATGVDEWGLWLVDDGVVAGAPALEGLTEEALLDLLAELEDGGNS